jgi:hypothetical protein
MRKVKMSPPLSNHARLVMQSPLQLRLRPVTFEPILLENGKNLLAEKFRLRRILNFLSRQCSRQQYPHEHEKPLRY